MWISELFYLIKLYLSSNYISFPISKLWELSPKIYIRETNLLKSEKKKKTEKSTHSRERKKKKKKEKIHATQKNRGEVGEKKRFSSVSPRELLVLIADDDATN